MSPIFLDNKGTKYSLRYKQTFNRGKIYNDHFALFMFQLNIREKNRLILLKFNLLIWKLSTKIVN